jgi:hypothetical protein
MDIGDGYLLYSHLDAPSATNYRYMVAWKILKSLGMRKGVRLTESMWRPHPLHVGFVHFEHCT